jgi:anti-sigma regulatory factor (Ser/Thr protein kinase)
MPGHSGGRGRGENLLGCHAVHATSGAEVGGHTVPRAGFEHDALLYDSPDELTAVAGAFLREGLTAGETGVIAVDPETADRLSAVVGHDPRVLVLDRSSLYRARTPTAIAAFRRLASEHTAPGRRIRVVGEIEFGSTPADWSEWQRYESVINSALAALPASGLCLFDSRLLPEPILTTARHTHPQLRTGAGRVANPHYIDPAGYLSSLPVPEEPLESTAPVFAARDVTDVIAVRHAVRDRLTTVEGPADLIDDFLLAVDEMASNAARHGHPPAGLRLWTAPGSLVCTITDSGRGWDDPFAGYGPAHGEDLSGGGMGLWLARQLCDHVAIRRTPEGTSVRLTTSWS